MWPARSFGMEFGDQEEEIAVDSDGEEASVHDSEEGERRGISFAEDTDGSGTSVGTSLRKSYAAGEYGGLVPTEDEAVEDAEMQAAQQDPLDDGAAPHSGGEESPHNSMLPTITRVAVHGAELCYETLEAGKEKSYMGYTFIVTAADGRRWRVTKRYSDFDKLKKALVLDVPEVKKWVLPRKTLPGKKDSEKVIQARKEGLAKFMAGVAAVAGAHEVVQEFVTGEDSTYAETVSDVGEVDPGTPAGGATAPGDVDASWSASAGALEEVGDPMALTVAAVRMQDASAAAVMSERAIDMITPVGLKLNKKVEEGLESETGVKARKSYLKGKRKAKTVATEANEKAVKMAGYDESGSASLERLTELTAMRNSALECYGPKSPQYLAIGKKVQLEVSRIKEKEARRAAEVKREQATLVAAEATITAAEQAAATPEQTLGGQIRANAEAMSKDFAARASQEDVSGVAAEDSFAGMNDSAMAAKGEIADSIEPEPQPSHEFMLMVTANEFVPYPKKVRLAADSLDEICDRVAEALAFAEPVFVCGPADSVDEALPFESFEDFGAKMKISVWPARCFGVESEEDVAEGQGEEVPMADDGAGDAVEPQRQQEQPGEEVGVPPSAAPEPAAAVEARRLLLMVTANDVIPNAKKLNIEASDIDELYDKVAEGLGMSEPVFVCPVAGSVDEAIPFESLDDIGDKAKVSVWPARSFGMEFGEQAEEQAVLPEGLPPQDGGGEFDPAEEQFTHDDAAFNEMMMAEAQAAEEEEAAAAAVAAAAAAQEVEEQRRVEAARVQAAAEAQAAAAAAQAAEEAKAAEEAAAAKEAEQARILAEQEAAARLLAEQKAAEQAAATAAAAAAAEEVAAAAEAAAAAAAAAATAAGTASDAAVEEQDQDQDQDQDQEEELAAPRKFILMVVANDVIKPARLLRIEAKSLRELRGKVSEGTQTRLTCCAARLPQHTPPPTQLAVSARSFVTNGSIFC